MSVPIEEQRRMLVGIKYLARITEHVDVLRRHYAFENLDPSIADEGYGALDFAVNTAMPTFAFLKLGIVIDSTVKSLWQLQHPNQKSPRFDDQLKDLRTHHVIDASGLQTLKKLRNLCAHDLGTDATWEQFDEHFDSAIKFIVNVIEQSPLAPKK